MQLTWPFSPRRSPATLEAIYITAGAGQPMQTVNSIDAITDTGLAGDRYARDRGFWKSIEACQVTLISEDDLLHAGKRLPDELFNRLRHGGHRRNLLIRGMKTRQLQGKTFRIGTAIFEYHKPRPPCGYLEQVTGKGIARALGNKSGICLRIKTGGKLTVGDSLEVLEQE
jgi:MOSC domain-containing protein YiiM